MTSANAKRFLFLLGSIHLLIGQVSFAEGLPLDTAARPVNSGSSAALSGAPLPGIPDPEHKYMQLPTSNTPTPVVEPVPKKKPAGFQLFKSRVLTCFYPLKHPKKALDKVVFPVVHPLQFGKACESSGANGLIGFIGGCAQVGSTAILGARKF